MTTETVPSAPKVVFDILAPNARFNDVLRRFQFFDSNVVLEYYIYEPAKLAFDAWFRNTTNGRLEKKQSDNGLTSPYLGVHFLPHCDSPLEIIADFVSPQDSLKRAEIRAVQAEQKIVVLESMLREIEIDSNTLSPWSN